MNTCPNRVAFIAAGFLVLTSCNERVAESSQRKDRITTLYSVDDVLSSWSFSRGEPGKVCLDGRIYNRNSQLLYDRFGVQFVAGAEGASKARILDIGDLRVRGQLTSVYHGLTRKGRVIIAENVVSDASDWTEVSSSERSFDLSPGHPLAKSAVEIGHVYLIRWDEGGVDTDPVFVALRILAHVPKRYVTFRWRLL